MPLEVGNFGAADENILTSPGFGLLFLDLKLHHVRRVLDNLGNEGIVTRANFTQDTLVDPDNTTDEPVPLWPCQCLIITRVELN